MDNKLPERKKIRLGSYDYSKPGIYFITVCVKNRMPILWNMKNAVPGMHAEDVPLSDIGHTVKKGILQIPDIYSNIKIKKFCIMPDHIHVLIQIEPYDSDLPSKHPTIPTVIGSFKRWVSKETGMSMWQKSFIDRVVRDDDEYRNVWKYIDNNPTFFEEEDDGLLDFENM